MEHATYHVATLIAAPGALSAAIVERVRKTLTGANEPQWLDSGTAADISFNADNAADQRAIAEQVRGLLSGAPVDVVVQQANGRRKKLFVADMDSTMIGQECIDELADYAGLKSHVAAITERAMRGEIEFAQALRARVALLQGVPLSVIEDVITQRVTITPGARTLVATMRKNGAYTCLVSGGFTLFTRRIAEMIGFDEHRANILVIEGERLAGRVQEPILGREAKLQALLDLRQKLRLSAEETLAAGDGANDIPMIEAAGLGIAYHAKPAVAAAAHARIEHGDLTALLYAQGYPREEFVEA